MAVIFEKILASIFTISKLSILVLMIGILGCQSTVAEIELENNLPNLTSEVLPTSTNEIVPTRIISNIMQTPTLQTVNESLLEIQTPTPFSEVNDSGFEITSIAPTPITSNSSSTSTEGSSFQIDNMEQSLLFDNRTSQNERILYRVTETGTIKIIRTGKVLSGYPLSPAEDKIIIDIGTNKQKLVIIDLSTGEEDNLDIDSKVSAIYWSPDGAQLLYVESQNQGEARIGLHTLATQKNQYLTNEAQIVSLAGWNRDGDEIAFVSNMNGQFDLFTLNINSMDLLQHTNTLEIEAEVHWSPVANQLIYGTLFSLELPEVGPIPIKELLLLDISTSTSTQLGDFYYENPSWSSDGNKIAFGRNGVCILDLRDESESCPTLNNEVFSEAHTIYPVWSKNDQFIAFRASVDIEVLCYEVFVIDIETSNSNRISPIKAECGVGRIYWGSFN